LEEKEGFGGLFQVTKVKILNPDGAKTMNKPVGNYVTLENCLIDEYDESFYEDMAQEISIQLKEIICDLEKRKRMKNRKILVAGLGNRDATPDALGPAAVEQILVTTSVLAVAPGVMAQTGLETSDYIRGISKETDAGLIIAIDSLAARSTRRLNTTVQITDTGINPGSGVGNHRKAINEETMGVPVIAIGVPTVVDAATIVNDVMENFFRIFSGTAQTKGLSDVFGEFSVSEKRQLVKELMELEDRELYVTPKDIDENIAILGKIISEGLNGAL
jgi:spore protease